MARRRRSTAWRARGEEKPASNGRPLGRVWFENCEVAALYRSMWAGDDRPTPPMTRSAERPKE
jgi:hypothetical protein